MTGEKKPIPPKKRRNLPGPRSPEPPLKPKPKAPPKIRIGAARGGRPPEHDWNAIRRAFVQGGDEITLKSLSSHYGDTGRPHYINLSRRASDENWKGLRAEFRLYVEQEQNRLETIRRAETKMDAIEEVRKRHDQAGKAMMILAAKGLQHLMEDPSQLKPVDVARFNVMGADMQRKARGIPDEVTVNLNDISSPEDVRRLSTPEIHELLRRRRLAFGADSADDRPQTPGQATGLGMGLGMGEGQGEGQGETEDGAEDD